MVRFLCAAAVLIGSVSAGNDSAASVKQIRDTLKNLLRSVEDNGRDSEALFGKRQLWCDSAVHEFEAANVATDTNLADMKAQLTETNAEVAEAEGTVQQVKVDIEMVQHTIKQTGDMLNERSSSLIQQSSKADTGVLNSLFENKKLSLASLQGQLQVAVPVLAQLQASVAETKQRISYRTDSAAQAKDFLSTLKQGCQAGADRADSQGNARVGETSSIHAALQALDSMTAKAPTEDTEAQEAQAAIAPSFVQVTSQEVTTDDLSDLFASDQQEDHSQRLNVARQRYHLQASVAPALKPRIQSLISELKSVASTSDQSAWCSGQRESSAMALKFAQDSTAQITSEVSAHTEAEAELSEELTKLQTLSAAVTDSCKTVLAQATKEETLVQGNRKDQVLATKILDQATTILGELALPNSAKAVTDLKSAKKMFAAQIQASADFERAVTTNSKAINEKAIALAQTQESEQHNLEFARDDHASQRLSVAENKRLYEADVQEATTYLQKLQETCKATSQGAAKQQRSAQVHALEDAEEALDGKLVEAKSSATSLRGNPKPGNAANLTPMQRAAMEMGISSD